MSESKRKKRQSKVCLFEAHSHRSKRRPKSIFMGIKQFVWHASCSNAQLINTSKTFWIAHKINKMMWCDVMDTKNFFFFKQSFFVHAMKTIDDTFHLSHNIYVKCLNVLTYFHPNISINSVCGIQWGAHWHEILNKYELVVAIKRERLSLFSSFSFVNPFPSCKFAYLSNRCSILSTARKP